MQRLFRVNYPNLSDLTVWDAVDLANAETLCFGVTPGESRRPAAEHMHGGFGVTAVQAEHNRTATMHFCGSANALKHLQQPASHTVGCCCTQYTVQPVNSTSTTGRTWALHTQCMSTLLSHSAGSCQRAAHLVVVSVVFCYSIWLDLSACCRDQ
jgi:hypothetical protein